MGWDYAASGSRLEALKCTETYEIPSFEHVRFLNYTKFFNYKNESLRYNLCSSADMRWVSMHCNYSKNKASFSVSVSHKEFLNESKLKA